MTSNQMTNPHCVSVLHVCAPNDIDGNPCRCYVALGENNRFLGAWPETYAAHNSVPSSIRHLAVSAFHIEAPAKQVEAYIEWHDGLDAPLC
jgi:hypothetical protein